jgi:hypothetical protein
VFHRRTGSEFGGGPVREELESSADAESGGAAYAVKVRPVSAVRSIASKFRVSSPTAGWRKLFTPVRWRRTSWAAQRVRKSGLRVHSSPTRSVRSRLCGSRPASVRRMATEVWQEES